MIGASSLLLPPVPAARCPRAFSGVNPSRAAASSGPGGVHNGVQQPGHSRSSIRCQSSTGTGSEEAYATPQAPIVAESTSAISRRSQLVMSSSLVVAGLIEHLAIPGKASAGFERYIRKRRNDPLEFYIPVVLEAREQLADTEQVRMTLAAELPKRTATCQKQCMQQLKTQKLWPTRIASVPLCRCWFPDPWRFGSCCAVGHLLG